MRDKNYLATDELDLEELGFTFRTEADGAGFFVTRFFLAGAVFFLLSATLPPLSAVLV